GRVATETITSVLLLALVFFALRVFRALSERLSISRGDLIMLGLLSGMAILHRTVLVPVVLLTLIFVGVARYRTSAALVAAARTVGVLALLIAACLSPWFIRNYLVWHTFVYHTNMGSNWWLGFNDLATGGPEVTILLDLDYRLVSQGYNELERDR